MNKGRVYLWCEDPSRGLYGRLTASVEPLLHLDAGVDACKRLSAGALYVDDSSDTGVLEVRAKSRRLHHQLPGGLNLIIVDYLQLMRHEGRLENRVEQVGQISRGLKGLARG